MSTRAARRPINDGARLPSRSAIERADLLTSDEPGRTRDYRRMETGVLLRLLGTEQERYHDRFVTGMHARFVRRRLAAIEVELMIRGIPDEVRTAWRFGVAEPDADDDAIEACERFALARPH